MKFQLEKAIELLERTPLVLEQFLNGLSDEWIYCNEGDQTWNAFDIMGHLIHGEKTDWIPRLEIILSEATNKTFETFDRFAMFEDSKDKSLHQLIAEFKLLRFHNLSLLKDKNIQPSDYAKTSTHPSFGTVTLSELLSCWVAHDLDHIAQISRVMALQYKEEVGPWIAYLRILK